MNKTVDPAPFLKWAGGKRQLLPEITKKMPKEYNTYFEPFVGGGAVLFSVLPGKAVINDVNFELYNCYTAIRDRLEELISYLEIHKQKHSKDYFYEIRELDRLDNYEDITPTARAARIMYMNRTCYNGLLMVNSSGHFNVPFGKYKNPKILNEPLLRSIHRYFNENDIQILNTDFTQALKDAKEGDFVYLDPPYDPLSTSSSFTRYSRDDFRKEDQERLCEEFKRLDGIGCKVLLSNSATEFILDLYDGYKIKKVNAVRNINSRASGRGAIKEVLVTNY